MHQAQAIQCPTTRSSTANFMRPMKENEMDNRHSRRLKILEALKIRASLRRRRSLESEKKRGVWVS